MNEQVRSLKRYLNVICGCDFSYQHKVQSEDLVLYMWWKEAERGQRSMFVVSHALGVIVIDSQF